MQYYKNILKNKKVFLVFSRLQSTKKTKIKFKKLIITTTLFLGCFFVLGAKNVRAATYTVCSSGCSETTIQAVFDNNDLEPGDVVEVQADTVGGNKTYLEKVSPGSDDSGDSVNYVYIKGRAGDNITIDANGNNDVFDLNADDWLHISNFVLTGGTNSRIIIWGSCENLILDNITYSGGGTGYGINAVGTNSQITVSNSNFVSNATGIRYNNVQSNFVIADSNINATGGSVGISITATEIGASTISNIDMSGGSSNGLVMINVASGSLAILDSDIYNFDSGVAISNSQNVTFTNVNSYNNNSSGLSFSGTTSNITLNNCVTYGNSVDGYTVNSDVHDIIYNNCVAYDNGIGGSLGAGDGFTAHNNAYNLTYNNCIAYNNANTGFALIHNTHGHIYNCSVYNNGDVAHSVRAGIYIDVDGLNPVTSDTWKIKNSISENSYTRELLLTSYITTENLDYNMYFRSADSTGDTFAYVNGSTTSWVTYSASREHNSSYTSPVFSNNSSSFSVVSDFNLQSLSPAIDSGTDIGLTTDYAGNPIYGNPDIGAYEYQPPYVVGTDEIDTTADVRIYGDGKFRNTQSAGGTTADLSVDPVSDDKTEWLDIDITTWDTATTYTKEWIESSTNITGNTVHTIGDLEANKYYNVSVDATLGQNITGTNCTDGICKSNSQGEIVFTYTGTYSTHTFTVEEGDNMPAIVTNNTNIKFHTDITEVNLSITTDENVTCKYSTSQNDTYDNKTIFTTTGATNHLTTVIGLAPNNYTYYVICQDTVGNETNYTLTFEIAQPEVQTELTKPKIKIGNTSDTKTLSKNTKLYLSKDKAKLKGQDVTLANGKVKIYKDDKKYDTVKVNDEGRWGKKLSFGHTKNYIIKLKFYDQYETLLNTEEYKIEIDKEKPTFKEIKDQFLVVSKNQKIQFPATDNESGIKYYKVKLLNKDGKKLRSWRKQKDAFYHIPEKVKSQAHKVVVRVYDKAGNKEEIEFLVRD